MVADITSKEFITGEKSFTSNLSSNLLNITGLPAITHSFSDTVATTKTASINGWLLTLSALNSSVAIGKKVSSNVQYVESSSDGIFSGTTLTTKTALGIKVDSFISGPNIITGAYVVSVLSDYE